MKKIIITIILIISLTTVRAEEQVQVKLEWVPNVYYNYKKDGVNYWGQFAYIYANDRIAYCLDISKNVNSSVYTKSNELQTNNLVILAGYFGYNYENNSSLKDYMATQKLIWQYLGTSVYFTTESHGKGDEIDIDSNISRIIYKINNHAYFPTYNSDYKFIIGSENYLSQTNTRIGQYEILNNTNNIIKFNDEGIIFNANDVGENYFYLQTKYNRNFDNEIYVADNSQKIMIIGGIENLRRKYSYEVIGANISINVSLQGKNNNYGGNVEENEFELYLEDQLIGKYNPNYKGQIIINNLNIGNYKLKHKSICNGYVKKIEEYDVLITKENTNVNLDIVLNLKKSNVIINKTYGNPILNTTYKDDGVKYIIYDDAGNFVGESITNDEGMVQFDIEYGNYKIVQSTTSNINKFHDDIIINVSDFDDTLIYNIFDEYYDSKIKFVFLDRENNLPISNVDFIFDDIQYVTGVNNSHISPILQVGKYVINAIKNDNYKVIEEYSFDLNETSKFYINENNEIVVDEIIYLEKIDKSKDEEIYDNDDEESKKEENIENEENQNDFITDTDISVDSVIDNTDSIYKEESIVIEKLPFLGEYKNVSKYFNYYNFKYYGYIFNFM